MSETRTPAGETPASPNDPRVLALARLVGIVDRLRAPDGAGMRKPFLRRAEHDRARFCRAIQERPLNGGCAAILGQQRSVQVDAAQAGDLYRWVGECRVRS